MWKLQTDHPGRSCRFGPLVGNSNISKSRTLLQEYAKLQSHAVPFSYVPYICFICWRHLDINGEFSEQNMFEVCNRNPLYREEEDVNVGNSLTDLFPVVLQKIQCSSFLLQMVMFIKADWLISGQLWFFSSLSGICINSLIRQWAPQYKSVLHQGCSVLYRHTQKKRDRSVLASLQCKDYSRQRVKDENAPDDPELIGTALLVTYRVFYLQVVKEKGKWDWLLFAAYLIKLRKQL